MNYQIESLCIFNILWHLFLFSLDFFPCLNVKVHRKKSYLLRFILCFAEACTVFRVPFGYQFNKDDNLSLKFLIISISLESPFFHSSILLISREKAAPYKSPSSYSMFHTASSLHFSLASKFNSLLGLFLPWDMKSECVAKLSEKVLFFVASI